MSDLQRWQKVWVAVAAILLVVVGSAALENAPTRDDITSEWATALRATVERSEAYDPEDDSKWAKLLDGPEAPGTYGRMSPHQIILEVHARYRPLFASMPVDELNVMAVRLGHVSFDAMAESRAHVALESEQVASIATSLANADSRHQQQVSTFRSRQLKAIGTRLLFAWALPMGMWFGVGSTASRWRPLLRTHRQVIPGIMFVVGAGALVVGFIDGNSFSGGLGAMVLVAACFVRGGLSASRAA